MKVILLEDVEKVGHKGEMVEVSNGYARNYLIPRKHALAGTPENIKRFEHQKKFDDRKEAKLEAALEKMAEKIAAVRVEITVRAGDEGKLYGSVTAADITAALNEKITLQIDKRRVLLDHPLKTLGNHSVTVRLSGKQEVTVAVAVVEDPADAARRKEAKEKAEREAKEKAEAENAAQAAAEAEATAELAEEADEEEE